MGAGELRPGRPQRALRQPPRRRKILEDLVLEALQKNLMHPDLVAEFVRAYQAEVNAERASEEQERLVAARRLEQVSRQLEA